MLTHPARKEGEGEGTGDGLAIIFGHFQPKLLLFDRRFSAYAADGAAAVAVPTATHCPHCHPLSPWES